MEILDSEKRRARNLIWNAAGEYGFEPDFKAYDHDGRAELYWNSIIGAVRKNYGAETTESLFSAIHGRGREELFEQLLWLGLENAAFLRESTRRPALESLRRRYAQAVLFANQRAVSLEGDEDLLRRLENGHFRRALGETPELMSRDREMLDTLEFSGDLTGEEIRDRALAFLEQYFQFVPGESEPETEKKPWFFPSIFFFGVGKSKVKRIPSLRTFGHGYGEHAGDGEEASAPERRHISDRTAAETEMDLAKFIREYFGTPLYDQRRIAALEEAVCTGDHKGCRLYCASGDGAWENVKGYVGNQRKEALKQMERNKALYEADGLRHRASVVRLTARIRNAMTAYLQPTEVRTSAGTLDAGRVWRGVYLDDDKIFTRVQNADPGQLSVDLLLDCSHSQAGRQAAVAAQGYMIAESLTRCYIPVRVSSFCSLSGYTVLTRYRDYLEPEKNERIFHYFAAGCNRDGLALKLIGKELEDNPWEHQMVILLSDAKPNDVVKMPRGSDFIDYAGEDGVQNTAMEVRSLIRRGVAVVCVFTGEDEDLPSVHTIYGRDFARIRSLDQFADTVGTLIQNQIRSF